MKDRSLLPGASGGILAADEYTYEDYEREFLMERSEDEVYADDGRRVADFQILEAGLVTHALNTFFLPQNDSQLLRS